MTEHIVWSGDGSGELGDPITGPNPDKLQEAIDKILDQVHDKPQGDK